MTLHDFIDYCATNKIPAAEITTYFFEPEVTESNLLNLRLHAQNHGVTFSGTAIGNNFSCLLYTSPSPRDVEESRMPSSA